MYFILCIYNLFFFKAVFLFRDKPFVIIHSLFFNINAKSYFKERLARKKNYSIQFFLILSHLWNGCFVGEMFAAHCCYQIRSDQISCSVVSDSLQPHESQHARPPCPSPTPGIHADSRSSSQ